MDINNNFNLAAVLYMQSAQVEYIATQLGEGVHILNPEQLQALRIAWASLQSASKDLKRLANELVATDDYCSACEEPERYDDHTCLTN